jgi:hypothetical protein
MRVLVGYGITDKAYTKLKEGKYADVYTEYFEISGVKVFDLDNFDFYDISLKDCIENQLDIIGCDIGFEKCSSEYGVLVNSRGGVFFRSDSDSHYMLARKRECSPLFYNNKPAIETGTELYMTYKHNCFTIVIELETLNFEIRVFEFTVLKSGDFNSNYEDFIYCVPDFGYTREISDKLTDVLKSIAVEECGLVYVNDVLAICNSFKGLDCVIKNGIKYITILIIANYNSIVIPPSVESIKIDKGKLSYGMDYEIDHMRNPIKLILPRVTLNNMVSGLLKSLKSPKSCYLGKLEENIDELKNCNIEIEVYG